MAADLTRAKLVEEAKRLADHAIHLALNVMDPLFDGTDRWYEVCAAINALRDATIDRLAAHQQADAIQGGGAGETIDLGINGSRCGTHGTSGS